MITEETTKVYVRVDLATRRIIGITDEARVSRPGKPIFEVESNQSRLDYYMIESDTESTFGITVRAATAEERIAADEFAAANAISVMARAKVLKAASFRRIFDTAFSKRFVPGTFADISDVLPVACYSGSDATIVDTTKPMAIRVLNALNEWRYTVCQPVIDEMNAGEGMGVEINDEYTRSVDDQLDAFLTAREFDIATYHR